MSWDTKTTQICWSVNRSNRRKKNEKIDISTDKHQQIVKSWDTLIRFGISVWYRLVFSRYFPTNRLPKENSVRIFGIVHLAGTPFSLASAPFLIDQAPLLKGVHPKFHKMELPPNLTVQKIPYIPYRIYQPASAGNLPIPAKLPVNRWDTTLSNTTSLIGKQLCYWLTL